MEDVEEDLMSFFTDYFNDSPVLSNEHEATQLSRVEDSNFDAPTLRRDVVDHPLQKFVALNSVFMKNEKGNTPIRDYLLVSQSIAPNESRTIEWFLTYLRDIIPGHVFQGSHFLAVHAIEHFEFTKSGKKWFNLHDKASEMNRESIEMIQSFKDTWFVAWDALLMEFKAGSLRTMFHNGRGCFFRVKKRNFTDRESDSNSSLNGGSIESGDTSHDSLSSDGANANNMTGRNNKRPRQDTTAGGGNVHGGMVAAGDVPQDNEDLEDDENDDGSDGTDAHPSDDMKDYVIVYAGSTHSDISGLTEESILNEEVTIIPEKDTDDIVDHGDAFKSSQSSEQLPHTESQGNEKDASTNNEADVAVTVASQVLASMSDSVSIASPTVSDITAPTVVDTQETHTPHQLKNKSIPEPVNVSGCDIESTVDTEIGRYRMKGPYISVDADDNDIATETYDNDIPDDDEEHTTLSTSTTTNLGKYNQRDRSKKVSYMGLQALNKDRMSLVEAVQAMNNEVLVNARYVSLSEVLSIVSRKVSVPSSLQQLKEQLVQKQLMDVSDDNSPMTFLRTLQPITGEQLRLCLDGNKMGLQATGAIHFDDDTIFVPRGREPLYRPLWNALTAGNVKPTVTEKLLESWLQEGRTHAVKLAQLSKPRGKSIKGFI